MIRPPAGTRSRPGSAPALVPLLARAGSMLTRAELLTATSPGAEADDRRTIDRVIRRLRLRLAPLGITIHTVRGCGFLLDMGALPG